MNIFHLNSTEHFELLRERRTDPVTGDFIREGDEVVFCKVCQSAFFKSSWEYLGAKHCEQGETLAFVPLNKPIDVKWHLKETIFEEEILIQSDNLVFYFSIRAFLWGIYALLALFLPSGNAGITGILIILMMLLPWIARIFPAPLTVKFHQNALVLRNLFYKKTVKASEIKKLSVLSQSSLNSNEQTLIFEFHKAPPKIINLEMTDKELIAFVENFGREVAVDFFAVNNHAFKIANEIIDKTGLQNFCLNPAHNKVLNISEKENFNVNELTDFDSSFLNWKFQPQKSAFYYTDSESEKAKAYLGNVVNNIFFDYALAFSIFASFADSFYWLAGALIALFLAFIVELFSFSPVHFKSSPFAYYPHGVVFFNKNRDIKLTCLPADALQNVFIKLKFGKHDSTQRNREDTYFIDFQISFHGKNGEIFDFSDHQVCFNSHERRTILFKKLNPIPKVMPCSIEVIEEKGKNEFTDLLREIALEKGFSFKSSDF